MGGAAFAIVAQKGGVGKTTTAVNLAAGAAVHGWRVLLVDIDPQFDATRFVGCAPSRAPATMLEVLAGEVDVADAVVEGVVAGVDLLAGDRRLRELELTLAARMERERFLARALEGRVGRYDLVLIDCPPNLGLLTVNAIYAARRLLVPVSMRDKSALQSLGEVRATVAELQRLGILVQITAVLRTMADPRRQAYQSIAAALPQLDVTLTESEIPLRASFDNAVVLDRPLVDLNPGDPGGWAYLQMAEELFGHRRANDLALAG